MANDGVTLCECFARDGLQHEAAFVPTAVKIEAVNRFVELGFRRIEATSLTNPSNVPQFADAEAVLRQVQRRAGVQLKATCVNPRSLQRAIAAQDGGYGPDEISVLISASEAHTQRNLRRSRSEQWDNVAAMIASARGRFAIVGTISVAFGCPFEGRVDPATIVGDARRFASMGVTRIAIGDSTGFATPSSTAALFAELFAAIPELMPIAHFHDTRGTGIANCMAAYQAGVRFFDCAFGGVGGHPARIKYGQGYTGNVCTEDLANLFAAMSIPTGLHSTLR